MGIRRGRHGLGLQQGEAAHGLDRRVALHGGQQLGRRTRRQGAVVRRRQRLRLRESGRRGGRDGGAVHGDGHGLAGRRLHESLRHGDLGRPVVLAVAVAGLRDPQRDEREQVLGADGGQQPDELRGERNGLEPDERRAVGERDADARRDAGAAVRGRGRGGLGAAGVQRGVPGRTAHRVWSCQHPRILLEGQDRRRADLPGGAGVERTGAGQRLDRRRRRGPVEERGGVRGGDRPEGGRLGRRQPDGLPGNPRAGNRSV